MKSCRDLCEFVVSRKSSEEILNMRGITREFGLRANEKGDHEMTGFRG